MPTELGKDDKTHLEVEMIQLKDVKNFKDTYIMDIESEITMKSDGLDTGDTLKRKLNTAHKPLGIPEDVGSYQDNWSITSIDVVFTFFSVLTLVCEVSSSTSIKGNLGVAKMGSAFLIVNPMNL